MRMPWQRVDHEVSVGRHVVDAGAVQQSGSSCRRQVSAQEACEDLPFLIVADEPAFAAVDEVAAHVATELCRRFSVHRESVVVLVAVVDPHGMLFRGEVGKAARREVRDLLLREREGKTEAQ